MGMPPWADLTIESKKTLSDELVRGPGLYAIHYRGDLIYVGKFCGKRVDAFAGRVCDIRWARHMGTLTLRDRRVSLSEGRCHQLTNSALPPLNDIEAAMKAGTIFYGRGRHSSVNRALFAAENWQAFSGIEDASGLSEFCISYVQLSVSDVEESAARSAVSSAEARAINQLHPRCNGGVREGRGDRVSIEAAKHALSALLHQAASEFGNEGQPSSAPPSTGIDSVDAGRRSAVKSSPDDDGPTETAGGGGGSGDAPTNALDDGPDDLPEPSAEELFWERIEGYPWAQEAIEALTEALLGVNNGDFHFTRTNEADIRVHSLARAGKRFNVARFFWQNRLKRFGAEIGLPPGRCLELGATTAEPNHNGKTLESRATFDEHADPLAICRCAIDALEAFRQQHGE